MSLSCLFIGYEIIGYHFFSLLNVCSSVFWPSLFMTRNLLSIIVCPLYVMCHFSLENEVFSSFLASCRLTMMHFPWVFSIWDLWCLLDVLVNVTKCGEFSVISSNIFPASLSFFLQGPNLHIHRDIWYYTRNLWQFWSFLVNIFLFVPQMGQFLLIYLQIHWFWCWAHLMNLSIIELSTLQFSFGSFLYFLYCFYLSD